MTLCHHRHVDSFGRAFPVKGAPGGTGHEPGYHMAQSGFCLDCRRPVLRVSAHVALGPWGTVAQPACEERQADAA